MSDGYARAADPSSAEASGFRLRLPVPASGSGFPLRLPVPASGSGSGPPVLRSGRVCTLIALHQVHRDIPLLVAANRDELYARPSSGPTVLREAPRAIGGRDQARGGTWLGASAPGFFVGLTNQRTFTPPDPALRSRGEVVLSALGAADLEAALAGLSALDGRAYNPFNLLLGDGRRLFVAYARPESARLELTELRPGIWALPNDRLGSTEFPKVDRAARLARPLLALPWEALVPRAQAMLADHEMPESEPVSETPLPRWLTPDLRGRLQALCVHTPLYGTRSATLLAISERGVERYLHADGPPCQAPLCDRADLVARLTG